MDLVYISLFSLRAYFFASLLIVILGLVDDFRGLNASQKLPVQITAAIILYFGGFRLPLAGVPFNEILVPLSPILMVLWIVGLTNAMNIVDGLDGLAAGFAAIGAFFLFLMSLVSGATSMTSLTSVILFGASVGFLQFNFFPAKIFMGDAGSLFLGFTLAALSLQLPQSTLFRGPIFLPAILFALPIMDTLFSIFRRFANGKLVFSADQEHFHHKLLSRKMSHVKAVLILHVVAFFLGLVVFFMIRVQLLMVFLLFLGIIGFFFIGMRSLYQKDIGRFSHLLAAKPSFFFIARRKRILFSHLVVQNSEPMTIGKGTQHNEDSPPDDRDFYSFMQSPPPTRNHHSPTY